jgi:CheY-like chemotaxis protein
MVNGNDRRNVLIVDDHEPTRLLVGRIVSQELRARVTLAGTCEEAVRLADEKVYDVILLDLLMPGIGGYVVLRKIRAGSLNRGAPILVLSVMATHESMEKCRQLGATAFLAKPVDRELVTTMLRSLLQPNRPVRPADKSATHDGGC